MEDKSLHYDDMAGRNLFLEIKRLEYKTPGLIAGGHWHEQIQFLYFEKGRAVVRCNSKKIEVGARDLVIINGREFHYTENTGSDLVFYVIKIDLSLIHRSRADSIHTQFLGPLSQNLILFENLVKDDKDVLRCVNRMIEEYFGEKIGFELSVKAQSYDLIVLLMRGYVREIYNEDGFQLKRANLERFKNVISYIENNFTEKITLDKLSNIAGISEGHFCRLFKQITGMSAIDYVNHLRVNKAAGLIQNSDKNMTEIAMNCGFEDSNYFSRVFRKHKRVSPMDMRRVSGKY